jgi:hypothetical protein
MHCADDMHETIVPGMEGAIRSWVSILNPSAVVESDDEAMRLLQWMCMMGWAAMSSRFSFGDAFNYALLANHNCEVKLAVSGV